MSFYNPKIIRRSKGGAWQYEYKGTCTELRPKKGCHIFSGSFLFTPLRYFVSIIQHMIGEFTIKCDHKQKSEALPWPHQSKRNGEVGKCFLVLRNSFFFKEARPSSITTVVREGILIRTSEYVPVYSIRLK